MQHEGGSFASIVVRRAADADLDAVVALLAAVAAEDRWIATQTPFDADARRAAMKATLKRIEAQQFVAVAGKTLAGNLGISQRRRGLYEFGMLVAAAWRGKGVGGALLSACIGWARAAGAHKMMLEVFPHNVAARALYAKFGFVEEGYFRRHIRRDNGELWDSIPMGLLLDER